jgi:uncharacterized UPF0160 family protein
MQNSVSIVAANAATHMTHGAVFHADEVFATAILSYLGPVQLCRTNRVPEGTKALVYDVGGGAYDHHQRGGNGARENGVPYSGAGLIWRDFGHQIVSCDEVWSFVDRNLIQGIDAVDNGVLPGVSYPAKPSTISNLISQFNPNWDEAKKSDDAFLEAVAFAQGVLERVVSTAESNARAKTIVDQAVAESTERIVVLPRFAPWQEHLDASSDPKATEALYVIFPSLRGGYNVQAIPVKPGSFVNRKPFPESWRGLEGEALAEVTGVADAIFAHKGGFICSAQSLKGALALARKAIEA